MADIDIRGLEVSVFGGDLDNFQVSEISLVNAVNALPSVTMKGSKVADAEDGKVVSGNDISKIASDLSAEQNIMFTMEQWASVNIFQKHYTTQDGETLDFTGVLSSPKLGISPGKVLESHSLVHPDFKLSGLNLAIYEYSRPVGSKSSAVGGGRRSAPLGDEFKVHLDSFSVAKALDKLVSIILNIDEGKKDYFKLKNFNEKGDTFTQDTHNQNVTIYNDTLKPILAGSIDETKLHLPQAGAALCRPGSFQAWLLQSVTNGNFLQVFQGVINSTFLFQHTCGFDVGVGESRVAHSQVNAGSGKYYQAGVELDILSLNYSLGGLGELPLGQILCSASQHVELGGAGHKKPNDTSGAAQVPVFLPASGWPVEKTPPHGETKHMILPGCFDVTQNCQSAGPAEGNKALQAKGDRNQKRSEKLAADLIANQKKHAKHIMQFASHWAAKHYVEQALRNCYCQISVPFDVNWGCENTGSAHPVGVVYEVSASSGTDGAVGAYLFEGYLSSVNHEVSVGNESGRAVTHLTFTHIKGINWAGSPMTPSYGCHPWVEK